MEVRKIPKKTVTLIEPKHSILVDKTKYDQKRVAAYCRVSTDSEEQLTSYKNQMKVYTEMIAANKEWRFAGLYADEGISGTRADKRPRFKQMINDCLAGKIDYIITKSVSRFARNTVDCLDTVRMLKARGIGIYFEEQNIDTLKSDSELYLVIYAGFAQSESESISKNVTWSFRKNFEEGKAVFIYKNFLGYKKGEDGNPEIVPYEAEIVERIFHMFLAGMTVPAISDKIKEANYEIPGKKFSFSVHMIQSMLRNERYCGDCILQKTVTVDCISKTRKINQGEAPMYIVENNHPAIIPREVFNKVQEEIYRRQVIKPKSSKNTFTSSGKYSKYALTQVLKCGECGTAYRRVVWTSHDKRRVVWRCINRLDNGTKYCPDSLTVPEPARLSQTLCKPPMWCRIEAPHWRFHYDQKETHP
ncbi:MAG: recombinase family protein [Paraprevotella sp.]|nr:recombinase family protein [Paraprevotella sp.]